MIKKHKNINYIAPASKVLLKNGKVLDILNGKTSIKDILISDGKIVEIGKIESHENYIIIDCNKKIITQAFTDIHTHLRSPGTGDQETFKSGSEAALAGGYSKICIMPDTNPIIDNSELVNFIVNQTSSLPVNIYPIGAITKRLEGVDLAEIGSMFNAGAVAISDSNKPLMNAQVARFAMEYAKMFNIPFINHPEDINLVNNGSMNESITSNGLGLSGNPSIAESIMIFRDLEIANYIKGKIHIPSVTTSQSINLINNYKNKKTAVSCEVSPQHLFFKDSDLQSYNSNLKITPPLRDQKDITTLIKGLKDGTIDCVASNHSPHKFDDKDKDFYSAEFGASSLEAAFAATHTILSQKNFSIRSILNLFSLNPSRIMGFELPNIKIGAQAELVVIDQDKKWQFNENHIFSKSKNSPFLNQTFKGKIEFTINKNIYFG
tara:strand:- start:3043 stop:4347 length:1305 start_codon:yes stop_codon:yes gene_type:complete